MKSIFTIAAMVAITCNSLFATTVETVLATYEKPMGQELITETVWCETPPKPMVLFNGVVANPVKDETMNNTNNCYMVKLDANHDWWAQFLNFRMTEPITITESNRYLHILHYRQKFNDIWMVQLNTDFSTNEAKEGEDRFSGQNSKEGVWEDIVIDLKYLMDNNIPLSKFMFGVSMDWNGPRDNPGADYYFDEIVLNNNPLPRGVNVLADKEMSLFFGNTALYNKWVSTLDMQNTENTSEIVDNPFTSETAVLDSEKVLKFNKSANAVWWQGVRVKLPGILNVGEDQKSSYLHVMVNIPEMEADKDFYVVQLNAKDFKGAEVDTGDAIKYWSDDKGKWKDCVLDVTSLGHVAEFTVRFDIRRDEADALINSPAGVFYLDAAAINNNSEERESVSAPTATRLTRSDNIQISTNKNQIVVKGDFVNVETYSIDGKRLSKIDAINSISEINVSKAGIYLVKITTAEGEIYCDKVIVR